MPAMFAMTSPQIFWVMASIPLKLLQVSHDKGAKVLLN